MSDRIGFIGLGIMGRPMARHLQKAGHALRIFSRTRARGAELEAAGAKWCDSPADVARECDVLLTIVTDTPDVEAVLFGARGAASTLPRGATVVDLSTISPTAAKSMAERLAKQGVALIDAPVTGGETGAKNATLTIMAGGDGAALERVRPILECLGKRVVHVGPSGSGQMLKACNQVLCAVNMIGVCEALTLTRQAGLNMEAAIEVLGSGAGGSWAWTQLAPKIAAGDLAPMFMIRLAQKDLRIAQDEAKRLSTPLPGTTLAQQLYRAVEALPGGAELGTQGMIRAFETLTSGTKP